MNWLATEYCFQTRDPIDCHSWCKSVRPARSGSYVIGQAQLSALTRPSISSMAAAEVEGRLVHT